MISVEKARTYYSGSDAAHDFDHVLRVLRLAERIGRAEGADLEVLRAAALLHDLGRTQELATGEDHALLSAAQARAILAARPPDRVEAVASAIAAHRYRNNVEPQTLEARVLYDADKLDSIGAIGVARSYAIAGRLGQRLWTEVPATAILDRGNLSPDHSPVLELAVKLAKVKDSLYTPTAQAMARERHDFMIAFFDRLGREVAGDL
jgi:uncharacterized protein